MDTSDPQIAFDADGRCNWDAVGETLKNAHPQRKRLSPYITTPHILCTSPRVAPSDKILLDGRAPGQAKNYLKLARIQKRTEARDA